MAAAAPREVGRDAFPAATIPDRLGLVAALAGTGMVTSQRNLISGMLPKAERHPGLRRWLDFADDDEGVRKIAVIVDIVLGNVDDPDFRDIAGEIALTSWRTGYIRSVSGLSKRFGDAVSARNGVSEIMLRPWLLRSVRRMRGKVRQIEEREALSDTQERRLRIFAKRGYSGGSEPFPGAQTKIMPHIGTAPRIAFIPSLMIGVGGLRGVRDMREVTLEEAPFRAFRAVPNVRSCMREVEAMFPSREREIFMGRG